MASDVAQLSTEKEELLKEIEQERERIKELEQACQESRNETERLILHIKTLQATKQQVSFTFQHLMTNILLISDV